MKPIAITTGDPAGIGPEIVFRAVSEIAPAVSLRIYGNWALVRRSIESAGIESHIVVYPAGETIPQHEKIIFVDTGSGGDEELAIGQVSAAGGRAALEAIDGAVTAIEQGQASGLVTAPINKAAIRLAGARVPGHTELLAARAGLGEYGKDFAMYFDSPTLRVALLTVHVPLREIASHVTADKVRRLALLVAREVELLEGRAPRIAVAGLNPHAGEGGMFGDEDEQISIGVDQAREAGLEIRGPLAADTVFHAAHQGRYDVVLAMYHDQGLIPVKTLHFNQAVNVTLGLPYLRASVDHGTAFDIAGKGVADYTAMRYAIDWTIERMSR
ncbi:MAG: 4-hydroxythreonine-4-phosphate dehydrogenase PdxA [Acidobacteria bacterium]|nr:4-hydroxythreonine-4-phosphate dehydrogenase PdxA [Acidobacteriota bacterium]